MSSYRAGSVVLLDRLGAEAEREELAARDHPVLPGGKPRDRPIDAPNAVFTAPAHPFTALGSHDDHNAVSRVARRVDAALGGTKSVTWHTSPSSLGSSRAHAPLSPHNRNSFCSGCTDRRTSVDKRESG